MRATVLAVAVSLLAAARLEVRAQSCVNTLYPPGTAGSISFSSSSPNILGTQVTTAVGEWTGVCPENGTYPTMLANAFAGEIHIDIVLRSVSPHEGCGQFEPELNTSGQVAGGTIVLYDASATGRDCEMTRTSTLAHEMGHVLGLGNSTCLGHMMGPAIDRSVQPDECQTVRNQWTTTEEQNGEPPSGPADSCDGLTGYGQPCSPIIVNLSDGPWRLSGADDAVSFDIDADGRPNRITWTARGEELAFLAVDRDGNGVIDDGAELFGTATRLKSGRRAANGFEALEELDANGDGVVDATDHHWHSLLLWIDRDHDGLSDLSEITSIVNSDVVSLHTAYRELQRQDQFGNTFRYMAVLNLGRGKRPYYDVFFRPVQ